ERPEIGEAGEAQAGREHERRCTEQHAAAREAVAGETEGDGERGRPEERSRHDRAHLEGGEAETREVAGEQDAHQPVDESAQRADAHEAARIAAAGRGALPPALQRRARCEGAVPPARTTATVSVVTGGSSSAAVKGCRR